MKRLTAAATVALLTVPTTAVAGRPFGRRITRAFRAPAAPVTQSQAATRNSVAVSPSNISAYSAPMSEERMTQIYGPSILIRQTNLSVSSTGTK